MYKPIIKKFEYDNIKGIINITKKGVVYIEGEIINNYKDIKTIKYYGAAPYDRRYSYMGSGLPFPNCKVAFYNSPNVGAIDVIHNKFVIKLDSIPNSYYELTKYKLIPPTIILTLEPINIKYKIILCDTIPYRSLSQLKNKPVRSTGRNVKKSKYNNTKL